MPKIVYGWEGKRMHACRAASVMIMCIQVSGGGDSWTLYAYAYPCGESRKGVVETPLFESPV